MKKTLLLFAVLFTTAFGYTAQAVESHTVVCTAGNLATEAAGYLTTVTNLTVTGTIDARDFKTMRDAMPLLEVIDLSGTTIATYTGAEGTAGTDPTSFYPADYLPEWAFCDKSYIGKTSLKTFIFPPSVKFIGFSAFQKCTGLIGSLTIPSSVTFVSNEAFAFCSGLTGALTIPSSVTYIGRYAFYGCSGFTGALTLPTTCDIGDQAFKNCSGLTGSLTTPEQGLMGYGAFYGCSGLTALNIPATETTIPESAFGWCTGLTGSLTIPSSVTSIGAYAFSGCWGFSGSLTIPSSITTIPQSAFSQCSGLTSITIPSSVTTIGSQAFGWCSGLTSFYANSATPINISASSNVFKSSNNTTCILHVPAGSMALYQAANQWQDFTNIVDDITPAPLATNATNVITTSFIANWNSVSIATNYFLDVATDNAFANMVAGYNNIDVSNALSKSIEGLSAGTTYYYRVRTSCPLGTSESSNVISTTTKLNQVIAGIIGVSDKIYGSSAFAVRDGGAGASGNPVIFTSSNTAVATCTGTNGKTVTIVGVGSCTIKANQLGNSLYMDAPEVSRSFTVSKAPLNVKANAKTRLYGAANPTFDVTITGFVYGQTLATSGVTGTADVNCTADATTNVGTATITPSLGSLTSNNYFFYYTNSLLTITPAPLTVTADDQTKVYGDANPTLTESYSGFVNGDTEATLGGTLSINTTATDASGVNNYPITASGYTSSNYNISYVAGNLAITPAPLTVTADDQTKIYGDANPMLTESYSGFVNGDTKASLGGTLSLSTTATDASGVNNYPITVSGYTSSNYNISYVAGNLAITPAPLTVTADNQTKVYGDANPSLTESYSGFVNGDTKASLGGTLALNTTAIDASGVNNYPITASGYNSSNYNISYEAGNLSVTKAPLTVTANNQTKIYGEANPTLTESYTGFVNGDTKASLGGTLSLSTTATAASGVENYPITASGYTSSNYNISYVAGNLAITPAPLTVTADDQTKIYGEANPMLTESYSGFVNGDTKASLGGTLALNTTATDASGVNNYPITASGYNSSNYNISYIDGNLSVTKAPLTVTADDQTKLQGETNPLFTSTITGFVNGETLSTSGVTGTAEINCSADATTSVGTADIIPSLGTLAANNYTFDFVNGLLTIDTATKLDNLSAQYSLSIYPNPATSYIKVSELDGLASGESATLSVTDVLGSTLLVMDVEPSTNSLNIDVSSYKSGIYFVVIKTSNNSFVKRFVKK